MRKRKGDRAKPERVLIIEGTGEQVRHGEVVRGLVRKTAIEVAGDRGFVVCKRCGAAFEVPTGKGRRQGRRPTRCVGCKRKSLPKPARAPIACKECGKATPVAKSGRAPLYCVECAEARERKTVRDWVAARPERRHEYEQRHYVKRRAADIEKIRKYHREYAVRWRAKQRAKKLAEET